MYGHVKRLKLPTVLSQAIIWKYFQPEFYWSKNKKYQRLSVTRTRSVFCNISTI